MTAAKAWGILLLALGLGSCGDDDHDHDVGGAGGASSGTGGATGAAGAAGADGAAASGGGTGGRTAAGPAPGDPIWTDSSETLVIQTYTLVVLSPTSTQESTTCTRFERDTMTGAQLEALASWRLVEPDGACSEGGYTYTTVTVVDRSGLRRSYKDCGCLEAPSQCGETKAPVVMVPDVVADFPTTGALPCTD